jgi:hypothetical protein
VGDEQELLTKLRDRLEREYTSAEESNRPDYLLHYDDWRAVSWAIDEVERLREENERLKKPLCECERRVVDMLSASEDDQ